MSMGVPGFKILEGTQPVFLELTIPKESCDIVHVYFKTVMM